jgi:hypothetical protein
MIEISDDPGDAQHAIMSARREIHAANGYFERAFAAIIERAKQAELRGQNSRVIETRTPLRFSCRLHPLATLSGALAAVFFVLTSLYTNQVSVRGPAIKSSEELSPDILCHVFFK